MSNLEFYYAHNENPRDILEYEELVEGLSLEDIQQAAGTYFNQKNYIKAVLYPEDYGS